MSSLYIPTFPYRGAQILVTSDRVVIHSKADSIFLFGKKAVAISSPGRVNIDSATGITVNTPTMEVGLNAIKEGEPATKATTLIRLLTELIQDLKKVSESLGTMSLDSDGYLVANIASISKNLETLNRTCTTVSESLNTIKSTTLYIK